MSLQSSISEDEMSIGSYAESVDSQLSISTVSTKDVVIADLKKVIEEQERIIKNLKSDNELFAEQAFGGFQLSNEHNIEKLIKFIKIMYGFADMSNFTNDIYIYGSLLENLLSKKSLDDTKLYFLFNGLHEHYFNHFIERLHDLEYVINDDYKTKKRCFVSYNEEIIIVNHWDLEILLTEDLIINVTLHDNTYTEKIMFDCQNIVLTKFGLTVKSITENDKHHNRKYPSLSLLSSLNNLMENKISITKVPMDANRLELFETIETQNDFIIRGYNIKHGFNHNEKEDETCSICYREHKEDDETFLYELKCSHTFCSECLYRHMSATDLNNHENCPLCRQRIEIGVYIE